jgi:hypothetical protein
VDFFDKLAFLGRKYEPVTAPGTGSRRFTMGDVLMMFNQSAILELTPYTPSGPLPTVRPDAVRKLKVSLLDDGLSAIHSTPSDFYEVFRTAPSGDISKVRIVAYNANGNRLGEMRMDVGRRTYEHYFEEDPIIGHIAQRNQSG